MGFTNQPENLYVGLMSGTSMDGVDAALVQFGDHECRLVATHSLCYPDELRSRLVEASRNPAGFSIDEFGALDHWVAECFASATMSLLESARPAGKHVVAIGSHGQTVRHQPKADRPFTVQIGDPNLIAGRTGITTVADFRRRDVAHGGEGAPLASGFHQWLFGNRDRRSAVLNIGGIANLTVLDADPANTIGFDTGPGNTLLDAWIMDSKSLPYDEFGGWAKTGRVAEKLLQRLMEDPYLAEAPPKSTGFEYFNLGWLQKALAEADPSGSLGAEDVQATLTEYTAESIAEAIRVRAAETEQVVVCGGGVHNDYLLQRLRERSSQVAITSTAEWGIDPDWVEAAAFAWLALRTLDRKAGNLPSVTGADLPAVLGGVYFGKKNAVTPTSGISSHDPE